jgi:hypothetical protein
MQQASGQDAEFLTSSAAAKTTPSDNGDILT